MTHVEPAAVCSVRRARRLPFQTPAVVSLVVLALACKDSTPVAPSVPITPGEQPLIINPVNQMLRVPRALQLSTKAGRDTGPVSWESSDPTVATVSASGVVSATFPGSVTITAKRAGNTAALAIQVTATSIDVGDSPLMMKRNESHALVAVARDAEGAAIAGVAIAWSTGNASIAAVDARTGLVKGMGAGVTSITADGGGASGGVAVYVDQVRGAPIAFSSIGNVGNYACGLERQTGLAYCWGDNHSGALGVGDFEPGWSDFPLLVANGAHHFSSLSVGFYANCGIEVQTELAYCWGNNAFGELGDGTLTTPWALTLVGAGKIRFSSISAGGDVTCGIEAQTDLGYCWGKGGGIGDGTVSQRLMPAPVGTAGSRIHFRNISAGGQVACGIEAQTDLAYCWGSNAYGQIGDGTTITRLVPTSVAGGRRFSSIDAGGEVVCGIEVQTDAAYCWGHNNRGQVGDGTTIDRLSPTLVAGNRRFSSIDATWEVACGIEAATGAGYCWGRNNLGQVGDGTTTDRLMPTIVAGGLQFSSISASGFDVCAVEALTGRGYYWGHTQLVPVPLPVPLDR